MQRQLSYSYLLICLLFACTASKAQSYYFRHYQTEEGLAHNAVTTIVQDRKGFVWIGTRGGLNRFDGNSFKAYRYKGNKYGNLGNNIITAIAEDQAGMLWIGTGKGLFKYNPYIEDFEPLDTVPRSYVSHVMVDGENNLWFAVNSRLFLYRQQDKQLIDLQHDVSCLSMDKNKVVWAGNHDGVIRKFNRKGTMIWEKRIIEHAVPHNLRSITRIAIAEHGHLLVGCLKQGLKAVDLQTGMINTVSLRETDNTGIFVRDIAHAGGDTYWIGTESGIYIYNHKTKHSENLQRRADDPYSLADNAVYAIYKDHRDDMWVGTFFGGVNYYSKENARFRKYYPMMGQNSISGYAVREITADGANGLWIGTEDAGLNRLDMRTGLFTTYRATGDPQGLSNSNIHGLGAFGQELFIGPFYNGLEIMDTRTGRITDRFKLVGEEHGAKSDFVLAVQVTKDSTVLIGTGYGGSGLFVYDRQQKSFTRIPHIPTNAYVFAIAEDTKGNIWTGSINGGAYYYHPKTGVYGNVRLGEETEAGRTDEFPVYGIFEDSSGAIWFATGGGGLIRLDTDSWELTKFTTQNGLPSNTVFRVLEDDDKRLWVSSLKGLICYDMRKDKFAVYTRANGLITDQFNISSAYRDTRGRMYFGSVKGLIAFDPKDFGYTKERPYTYITGLQINNRELLPDAKSGVLRQSILYTDTVILAHDQNNFSIEFAALNYSSPEVTRYVYEMAGVDKGPNYLTKNRRAYFTDLAAGDYTFTVRAMGNVGTWIGQERRLFIRIRPPFWKTPLAYAAYLAALSALLLLGFRRYHRYQETKNRGKLALFEHQKEKEIYQAKIEFFTNIAHEIQTPITLILGPIELLAKQVQEDKLKKRLAMVDRNAKRLAALTNQLLDFRKTEMHQFGLNFVKTDINMVLQEQLATFDQGLEKGVLAVDLLLPQPPVVAFVDKDAFGKICSNLLSNALKYASKSVRIQLQVDAAAADYFSIQFCNDGKEIPLAFRERIFEPFFRLRGNTKPGTGIGLSLAKSLAELHHGSLQLTQAELDCIVFELRLPMRQKIEFNLSTWKKI